ncbi:uncharacterized protein LOC129576464 [Sitodiplosis mosellana]|uniref:uncharacterized protein LOC129576464 n=1 Tax=Sitodiplosis mosellana TaxID=263140 RepID=UPI00244438BF|nr:uncharacterized protein LOC129576464 [Sitodiplosis mosellana]XP_055317619.1 uncharacterized protein LOC129576464 [Sitodiplosis mosellana]XP_055317620.1 uncharacterized protein LOC129576464 [Sitodiplosis mosellana]XP_055317621.1 uncharacterized protein LOC129576464 [Sitodiplosis mosellana]XP_055317622.1 uncharacterized protein LOC129576464 [Sitodiplosis mosellana]
MNYTLDDSNEIQVGGRKGKTCSMTGCNNTHQRFPNMSFFRFPKELSRAKEWLVICERPDLMRRVDIGDITINNYYVCEIHFPNQILDYATRKILIKTAKPLTLAELKALPAQSRHSKNDSAKSRRRHSEDYDAHIEEEYEDDDDFDLEDSKDDIKFTRTFGVKIAKAEGNYHSDLLEPLLVHDENSYSDSVTRTPFCWTVEATRYLIKLRGERDAEFDQSGARKSQLWLEISNKMRDAGYDFTPEKVSKKWHNITITYQKNTDREPGSVNWEFFNDMHAIFRNKKMPEENSMDYSEPEPKQNGTSKRKTADTSVEDRDSPESEQNYRPRESQRKKRKQLEAEDMDVNNDSSFAPALNVTTTMDETWWRGYFEQKLELERKKMDKEDERHKDRMNFQKMAIMLQERVEKIKVEAMNNLTNALLRLQDSGKL